jgi:hypothetical protein
VQEFKFQQAIDAVRKAELQLIAAIQSADTLTPGKVDTGSMVLELRKLQGVRENLTVIQWHTNRTA